MDIRELFEKGKTEFENEDWDNSYFSFRHCLDLNYEKQVFYPYLAYLSFMTKRYEEVDRWLKTPFNDFLITEIDYYESTLKKEQWIFLANGVK